MKYQSLLVLLLAAALLIGLGACSSDTAPQTSDVPKGESSVSSEEEKDTPPLISQEEEYVMLPMDEEEFADWVVPEDAVDLEEIPGGVSFLSPFSYANTVAYYEELISDFYIEGAEETVDTEALGIETGWKFDGMHEERLFSVTVAANESGTVGVAVLY